MCDQSVRKFDEQAIKHWQNNKIKENSEDLSD